MNFNSSLNDSINKLEVDDKILINLSNHQISSIKDLWSLNRKDLKKMSFSDEEINQLIIKLQLPGIDLNKKIYNKD